MKKARGYNQLLRQRKSFPFLKGISGNFKKKRTNMVYTIFACLYSELVKTNTLTGSRLSENFHRQYKTILYYNHFFQHFLGRAFHKKSSIGVLRNSCLKNTLNIHWKHYSTGWLLLSKIIEELVYCSNLF